MEVDPRFEGVYYVPTGLIRLEDTEFNSTVSAIEEEFRALEKKYDV